MPLQSYDNAELCPQLPSADIAPRRNRKRPPMLRVELLGKHSHPAADGTLVNIWRRGDSYIARGHYRKTCFGETLGANEGEAATRLIEVLHELGEGSFVRASDRLARPFAKPSSCRLSIRRLCECFLDEKRRTRGERTFKDYRARLVPLVKFSEQAPVLRRWPASAEITREFVVELKGFLAPRKVHANGRPSSPAKLLSPNQRYNILDCCRTLFNWACKPQVGMLPSNFLSPFEPDLVGRRPQKDPLRLPTFPLSKRICLVAHMDEWQLAHLVLSLVLPLRPEDCAGLLVCDVNFERHALYFGTRFGGRDFGKGHQVFTTPFPDLLEPLLRTCIGTRSDGPLLRSRTVFEGRRAPLREVGLATSTSHHIDEAFRRALPSEVKTAQDEKRLVRRTIREMGGVSERELAREFAALLIKADLKPRGRFYDLRGSITTELDRGGVSHLTQRYVTGHTTADILNAYVALDSHAEMRKYFDTIQPLLHAMESRSLQLGLRR